MIDLVNASMAGMAVAFSAFGQPARYSRPADDACDAWGCDLHAFARGLRAAELEASAQQYDRLVVVRADALRAGGLWPPQRFDRIELASGEVLSVEDWRPAPASGGAVFAKLMAKGAG